ncbi:MAG: RsmB/NOP family class I SAM-dependent RNA methyltransferase [Alphaproteobacteria bacterium]
MTPGARLATALELLDLVLRPPAGREAVPGDVVVSNFLRGRRFIGSKDRRAIQDFVYGVLRALAPLRWWSKSDQPRTLLLAYLVLAQAQTVEQISNQCDGGTYRPAPLTEDERALLTKLAGKQLLDPAQPAHVRANLPEWLESALRETFGAEAENAMAALNAPAEVDLRVNTLKATRDGVLAELAAANLAAAPTPLSPLGIRLAGRTSLPALALFKDGRAEVQDEGSQLVSLLVDARAGMAVLDYCAGAGGKSVALAVAMQNQGRVLAYDAAPRRLADLPKRAARAGATIVEITGNRPSGTFDRVLVDAPCTGSGAWRRHPDAKWRLTPAELARLTVLQAAILAEAAALVKPGGRLVYVTCSVLRAENEAIVEPFLEGHPAFAAMPYRNVWAEHAGGPLPDPGPYLHLAPHATGTDGFFCAILQRQAANP